MVNNIYQGICEALFRFNLLKESPEGLSFTVCPLRPGGAGVALGDWL